MAKNKRHREENGYLTNQGENGPDPPKKKLRRSEDEANLAKIYEELADEIQAVRINAAGKLIKFVTSAANAGQDPTISVEERLIRGLCSGRKAARLGFSVALTEILRLELHSSRADSHGFTIPAVLGRIQKNTEPDGGNSGAQEKRDHLLGRRYAFQALLHSDAFLRPDLSASHWLAFIHAALHAANEKHWMRREIMEMLHEYLTSTSGRKLPIACATELMIASNELKLLKTPEGVGLWLDVQASFPQASLPKGVWHKNDPLNSKERQALSACMLDNATEEDSYSKKSGARQIYPSLTWSVILARLGKEPKDDNERKMFQGFWEACVVQPMFSKKAVSAERRSLGLQIMSLAVSTVDRSLLRTVLHESIIKSILDHRSKPDRYLFEAAKIPLDEVTARGKQESGAIPFMLNALLSKGCSNFDQATRTKTVECLISQAASEDLDSLAHSLRDFIETAATSPRRYSESEIRNFIDLLILLIRSHKDAAPDNSSDTSNEEDECDVYETMLVDHNLSFLARRAYSKGANKALFRSKLMACVNHLMGSTVEQASRAPLSIVLTMRMAYPKMGLGDRAQGALSAAYGCIDQLMPNENPDGKERASLFAFRLLFSLSILQVFNKEPDAVAALEDLTTSFQARGQGNDDAVTMVVELLLSFVSKPSKLFRKLAEQVFSVFAGELTEDSLESLINVLEQKENMSGQQELFAEGNEQDRSEDDEEEDDVEAMDVEDASDVELVNGEEASGSSSDSDSEDDSDSSSSAGNGAGNGEEDEEALFDKKLAEALGTGQQDGDDSDEDGSDMDDDQMMALEPHLTTIFKERQQKTSKKQEKKDAKENIINFKNRVLDLLSIYVKSQYAAPAALTLIMPLVVLVRETTNKQTGEKAFGVLKQYFDACSKNKSLPQLKDHALGFSLLENVMDEMRKGGSKLHASACSRSALFMAKVLVAADKSYFEDVANLYTKLMSQWWLGENKVQPSVFNEWNSWVQSTKQKP